MDITKILVTILVNYVLMDVPNVMILDSLLVHSVRLFPVLTTTKSVEKTNVLHHVQLDSSKILLL